MRTQQQFPGVARGRVLEPEVMDETGEVEAYLDGVATEYLDRMDDTFVARALAKLPEPRPKGAARAPRALDMGTGTGAIPVKMALRHPGLHIVGVDRARNMLEEARVRARRAGLGGRASFRLADGRRLPFPDKTFDLVVSNSLMHHLPDPAPVLDEMARVLKPSGSLFIRDLRRPHPRLMDRHIRYHGRFYRGAMFRLFSDSVRAAFTESEMRKIVERSRLGGRSSRPGVRVHRQFQTYLVIELP